MILGQIAETGFVLFNPFEVFVHKEAAGIGSGVYRGLTCALNFRFRCIGNITEGRKVFAENSRGTVSIRQSVPTG